MKLHIISVISQVINVKRVLLLISNTSSGGKAFSGKSDL